MNCQRRRDRARILEAIPPEKADKAAAINQRLATWRAGTFDPRRLYVAGRALHRP